MTTRVPFVSDLSAQYLQLRVPPFNDINIKSNINYIMDRQVNLQALRSGEKFAVIGAADDLRTKGFVFLDMTLMESSGGILYDRTVVETAGKYLQRQDRRGKGSRDAKTLHGHVSHRFKDSLRLLSGNQFVNSNCPDELVSLVKPLVEELDKAAKDIVKVLAQPLYRIDSVELLGDTFELPLLETQPIGDQSYGMVDLVCYHNQLSTPKIVVSAHQDPGLLILSLPATEQGLELWDPIMDQWVSPPRGVGVLWAGQAGSNFAKPCLHRVQSHGVPRVACWHEICTRGQLSMPLLRRLQESSRELTLGDDIVGTNAVLESLRRAENHQVPLSQRKEFLPCFDWFHFLNPTCWGRMLDLKPTVGVAVSDVTTSEEINSVNVYGRPGTSSHKRSSHPQRYSTTRSSPLGTTSERDVSTKRSSSSSSSKATNPHHQSTSTTTTRSSQPDGLECTMVMKEMPRRMMGIPGPKVEEANFRFVIIRKKKKNWWDPASFVDVLKVTLFRIALKIESARNKHIQRRFGTKSEPRMMGIPGPKVYIGKYFPPKKKNWWESLVEVLKIVLLRILLSESARNNIRRRRQNARLDENI